ncbi:MAG: hypothetical protein COA30_00525 [Sulfurimonas sp.]|nr:MAG: hypothetical protein COA30_00525 [Sulfurimonas sp.]
MNLLDEAKTVGKEVLESEEISVISALKLNMQMDEIEQDLPYIPKRQDRKSIQVIIDGVEISIGKENCDATILELFQEIVYNRQLEKITQYLNNKYPYDSCLPRVVAQGEIIDLELPTKEEFFSFEEIAEVIAKDVVLSRAV